MIYRLLLFFVPLFAVVFNLIAQTIPSLYHVHADTDVFIGFWRQCQSGDNIMGLSHCTKLLIPGCNTPSLDSDAPNLVDTLDIIEAKYNELSVIACNHYVSATYFVVSGLILTSFTAAAALFIVFKVKRLIDLSHARSSLLFWVTLVFSLLAVIAQAVSLGFVVSVRSIFTDLAALAKSYHDASPSKNTPYLDVSYGHGAAFWILVAGTCLSFIVAPIAYLLFRRETTSRAQNGWKLAQRRDRGAVQARLYTEDDKIQVTELSKLR